MRASGQCRPTYTVELSAILFTILFCASCASSPRPSSPADCVDDPRPVTSVDVPEIRPGLLQGYLATDELPDSVALLPRPPEEDSEAMALDRAVHDHVAGLRGTARWELAAIDADLDFPDAAERFSCALDAPINETDTPILYVLLRRVLTDAGSSPSRAKERYQRRRPFVVYGETTCLPQFEELAAENGSYPSGHTSVGWAWALVLSELAPARLDAILARGQAFGESRVVCNYHWQRDVEMGRLMGTATVARLHSNPTFRADMEAARAEIAALREAGRHSEHDCEAEAAALALSSAPSAPSADTPPSADTQE